MRLSSILPLLGAATLARAERSPKEVGPTHFNGVEVPPLLELNAETHDKEANATSLMMIKYYKYACLRSHPPIQLCEDRSVINLFLSSPYCPHCLDFAPTYQTAYEFYYTSHPEGTEQSFSEFYDYKFAMVNCAAYYDLCADKGVKTFPWTTLYKKGKYFDHLRGAKNMTMLSAIIEKGLEDAKPGSRPKNLVLPVPGAEESPSAEGGSVKVKNSEAKPVENVLAREKAAEEEKPKEKAVEEEKPKEKAVEEKPKEEPAAVEAAVESKTVDSVPVFPTPTIVLPVTPKSTATPNPNGESFPFTAESFQNQVTMTQDPWFVKFYAPWCTHCKALGPTWEQLAKDMKGRLNIGEVNCDKESRLCKDVRLSGYPTIILFKGAERVEYDGLRGLGDFLHFAESAVELTSGIPEVNAESFKALEEKEPVIFTYFFDHGAVSEDFMALERIPINLIGRARIVRTQDPELFKRFKISTWPRLMVAREGRPTYYTPLTPNAMRDIPAILSWMKSVWLPIVPELTAANAREIMDGKIVVLGILNREDENAFQSAQREMKSAANEWMDKQIQLFQLERQELRDAKQLRLEEAQDRNDARALRQAKAIRINMDMSDKKQVTFAWVDGVFWQRWIRTTYGIDVKDGDRVMINDEDNRRYWDTTITGNNISPSRTSIMETIGKVTQQPPKIQPKLTISGFEKVFFDFKMTSYEHPWLTLGCFSGIAIAALSWFRGRLRRTRPNFRLEDAVGMKEMREGLLGSGSNGKVD
ncbi:related to thioredoxin domain containing protein 5 precursor [Cephalotrichum gorgonifer]|uniref:Related to thioredoxin domain containing protein 5 n=1 Tax=Cephalotrichum gorgonifer TaxID=2041049 RepID=A0AAE8MTJ5_9PEZI|nr:related to thioredoxin domain containing protein 5 precursor [Cephalotrichum gorgonifer]